MDAERILAKKFNNRFAKKQNELRRFPAEIGDGMNRLEVDGRDGFIYVTIEGKPTIVFNNRVPNQLGTAVWVGYSPEEPNRFQVLSTRGQKPYGGDFVGAGYAPAVRYEWHGLNGGQDPVWIHQRALTFLRLSVSSAVPVTFELYVNVYAGRISSGTQWIAVPRQDVDIHSHVPTTAGKAAFVLFTVDTSGIIVTTKGSEVDIDLLSLSDIPSVPSGTAFVCGAVRVYTGQTVVREGRTNTDFVDLRFVSVNSMGGSSIISWNDLVEKPELFPPEPGSPYYDIPMVGMYRWVGDGVTTDFELLDIVYELQFVFDNSLLVDPFEVELSPHGDVVVFATAPTAGHVIIAHGIVRSM